MRTIDMSKYLPFANMGRSCKRREIREKRIKWPSIDKRLLEGSVRARVPGRADLDNVAEFWRRSYPEGYGSSIDWVFFAQEYEDKIALKEEWDRASVDKTFFMPIVEEVETGKVICSCVFIKDDKNLNVEFGFGAIHPDYRKKAAGTSMWMVTLDLLKAIEDESGAEYLTAFCTTWHDISQYLCFKQWGFKVAGIFPGQYTRWCGNDEEYRACEIHFYKFLGNAEDYATQPEEWQLIPEIRRLWNVLVEINANCDDAALREHRGSAR